MTEKTYPLQPDEARFIRIVRKLNPKIKNPVLIDVGSNVGDFTIGFLNYFPDASCTLIDPSKDAIKVSREKFSDIANVNLINCALGDKKEKKNFYDAGINTGCSSFYNRDIFNKIRGEGHIIEEYEVQIEKYDSLFGDLNVFYLKLDAEGYEEKIILGAKKSINKGLIKYIQFEYGLHSLDSGIKPENLIPLLYNKYHIINDRGQYYSKDFNEPLNPETGVINLLAILKENK